MVTKYTTAKELCEELWEFEKEKQLLSIEIQGINVWELIRLNVFNELSKEFEIYDQAHSSVKKLSEKIKKSCLLVWNSVVKNPFLGNYKIDYLLYDHPRKIQVDGSFIDVYTHYFLKESGRDIEVIETPHLLTHFNTSNERKKYRDHEILISFIKKRIFPIKLTAKEKEKIKGIDSMFKARFQSSNIDISAMIIKRINMFKQQYDYHKKLLKKRQPKEVYLVVFYAKHSIVAAAKDLGIKVIEFQHGVITKYHFAYNFSDPNKNIKYFPDKILTFGKFWAETEGFPAQTEIEVYGFPYLNEQLDNYKDVKKKQNQIIFISQGTIGKKLANYALEAAKLMPEFSFIYKLHPGEVDRWRQEYPKLIEAENLKNFKVVDSNSESLYKYLAESEFQVGVYSTAIFEGLVLDCKTILFNLPGIEYMEDLIEQNFVMLANNSLEFEKKINNFEVEEINKNIFFENYNNI